ncbi:MAG TPA: 16S rRNA (uracil(1498)-N(3))-methyltransferase [Thermodesulfovibrionales bacterium]|nr:16S rRNA (uracil(1498)-N(3))-methyltransferase [Thermodesulfovibrionales bacterium]
MNLILLFEEDFSDKNTVRLRGRRLKHAIDVLRPSEGDDLTVGLLNGQAGRGTITSISREELVMTVVLDSEAPPPLPLTLILALPRPKMLRRVLFSAACMGVKKIYLINAARVEKSFWKSPLLSEERIREQLMLGLEQAEDTSMPEVILRPLFRPFVEDELPAIVKDTLALVAHPAAEHACPRGVENHVTLAVGPEGGFIPYEIEKFVSLGFRPVSMGRRLLRVETAVPALLARLF